MDYGLNILCYLHSNRSSLFKFLVVVKKLTVVFKEAFSSEFIVPIFEETGIFMLAVVFSFSKFLTFNQTFLELFFLFHVKNFVF